MHQERSCLPTAQAKADIDRSARAPVVQDLACGGKPLALSETDAAQPCGCHLNRYLIEDPVFGEQGWIFWDAKRAPSPLTQVLGTQRGVHVVTCPRAPLFTALARVPVGNPVVPHDADSSAGVIHAYSTV